MGRTGWVWDEVFNWLNTGNGSGFFQPGGVIQPYEAFDSVSAKSRFASLVYALQYDTQLVELDRRVATDEELLLVHTQEYLNRLESMDLSGGDAGESAYFGPDSLSIAKIAAGGVINAVSAVCEGTVSNAYALVRPAGHHAEPNRGRGFCMFANTAVAVKAAQERFGLKRVAVVDWDVHHGNGTESIFWTDPSVLTISLHQDRLYPSDRGFTSHIGDNAGLGTNVNIPLPAGTGDGGYILAINEVVVPALERYRPELIVVGCGMDAAAVDPLGRMVVTSEGFGQMASAILSAGDRICGGRVVFAQEGGYSGHYVPFCGLRILEALTGVKSGAQDPYMDFFQHYPQLEVSQWQVKAVHEAAKCLTYVPIHD